MLDLIKEYLPEAKIKKSGLQIVAQCPFHGAGKEKTPSLFIHQDTGMWFCFGCHEGGGFKTFLLKLEVPDYKIDQDCARFNQYVEEYKEKIKLENEYKYHKNIFIANPIIDEVYLRPFKNKPQFLIDQGWDEGLLQQLEIGYDRIRERIIYPIRDIYGNLMGVSGGTTIGGTPKYKLYSGGYSYNGKWESSPFGPDFDRQYPGYSPDLFKSKSLWNYYRFYSKLIYSNKIERVFIVEGFKAALFLIQNGYPNTLALLGSNLYQEQTDLIRRPKCKLYGMLDNDEAGQKGTFQLKLAFPDIKIIKYNSLQPDGLTSRELHKVILQS
jgi:DNA primase